VVTRLLCLRCHGAPLLPVVRVWLKIKFVDIDINTLNYDLLQLSKP